MKNQIKIIKIYIQELIKFPLGRRQACRLYLVEILHFCWKPWPLRSTELPKWILTPTQQTSTPKGSPAWWAVPTTSSWNCAAGYSQLLTQLRLPIATIKYQESHQEARKAAPRMTTTTNNQKYPMLTLTEVWQNYRDPFSEGKAEALLTEFILRHRSAWGS